MEEEIRHALEKHFSEMNKATNLRFHQAQESQERITLWVMFMWKYYLYIAYYMKHIT